MLIAILIVITILFAVYLHLFSPAKLQKRADEAFIKDLENRIKDKKGAPDHD